MGLSRFPFTEVTTSGGQLKLPPARDVGLPPSTVWGLVTFRSLTSSSGRGAKAPRLREEDRERVREQGHSGSGGNFVLERGDRETARLLFSIFCFLVFTSAK